MAKIVIQVATASTGWDPTKVKRAEVMAKKLKALLSKVDPKPSMINAHEYNTLVMVNFDIGATRGNLIAKPTKDGKLEHVDGSTGNGEDGLHMQGVKGMDSRSEKNPIMTPEEAVEKLAKAVIERNAGKTKVAKPSKDKRKPGFGYGKYKASDVRRLSKSIVDVGAPFAWVEQTTGEMSPGQLIQEVKPGVWYVQIGDPTSTPQPQHAVMRVANMYAPMNVHSRALGNAEWRSTFKKAAREARGVDKAGFPKPNSLPRKPAILE